MCIRDRFTTEQLCRSDAVPPQHCVRPRWSTPTTHLRWRSDIGLLLSTTSARSRLRLLFISTHKMCEHGSVCISRASCLIRCDRIFYIFADDYRISSNRRPRLVLMTRHVFENLRLVLYCIMSSLVVCKHLTSSCWTSPKNWNKSDGSRKLGKSSTLLMCVIDFS